MRKILFAAAAVVLGLGVSAAAQLRLFPKPIQEVTAATMKSNGAVTQLSGRVRIVIDGAVVSADEATLNTTTNEVELKGNVRLTLSPPAPPR